MRISQIFIFIPFCYICTTLILMKNIAAAEKDSIIELLNDTNNYNSSGIQGGLPSLENSKLNKTEKEPEIIEKSEQAFSKAFVPLRDSFISFQSECFNGSSKSSGYVDKIKNESGDAQRDVNGTISEQYVKELMKQDDQKFVQSWADYINIIMEQTRTFRLPEDVGLNTIKHHFTPLANNIFTGMKKT